MLSELHEVELNLFPVVASMTGPAESEADGLVPESVNGTFKSIILIKEPVPLGEVLVAGQDDASCLFETDAVYQLEEEKSLLPVELAVADLIDDEAGILGKSVQKSSRNSTTLLSLFSYIDDDEKDAFFSFVLPHFQLYREL